MASEVSNADVNLDLAGIKNDLWLVKVPKYLAEKWMNTPNGCPVGKLRLKKRLGGRTEVTYSMNQSLVVDSDDPSKPIPAQYQFAMQSVGNQSLAVFSTDGPEPQAGEKRTIEGGIVQKIDCRPVANKHYIQLKKAQRIEACKPKRTTVQLQTPVNSIYKPVSITKEEKADIRRRKEMGKKIRMNKDELQAKLFEAFEKHQYYTYRDLQSVTMQPAAFLSEVLKEICVHGKHPDHPHMWELKEEYRHHSAETS